MLADIVGRVDRDQLVGWASPRFGITMSPYLTPDLIAAIEHGHEVAKDKGIDLYDAELFTGRQSVRRAKLLRAKIVGLDADRAVVSAVIGTSEDEAPPRTGTPYTYFFRLDDGSWKIDDFRTDPRFRTVKDVFLHPEIEDPIAR